MFVGSARRGGGRGAWDILQFPMVAYIAAAFLIHQRLAPAFLIVTWSCS